MYCRAGSAEEKGWNSRGKTDEVEKDRLVEKSVREAERETVKLAFQKAIDCLTLKIPYWIRRHRDGLLIFFSLAVELKEYGALLEL